MTFSKVATKKISDLIKRDLFKEINNSHVYLKFTERACKVDAFGRVTWI